MVYRPCEIGQLKLFPIISVAARYGIIPKAFPAGDTVADLA
jgi:hypothetical protein